MARFYARFDSGSGVGGWTPDTPTSDLDGTSPNGYFNRLRISNGSASAALLRDGLIASRSAVSTDFYEELDSVNQNGGLGIFFPADQIQTVAGILTASAYTASAANTQGIFTPTNYRTRPTASITSSQTTLIGPTNPLDSGSVNYNVYLAASSAVKTVLESTQNGAGTPFTPFNRSGNRVSRTLHSIWHDPDLQYFAWDDFTPGTPQGLTLTESSSTDFYYTNDFKVRLNWSSAYQYRNDAQAQSLVSFQFSPTGELPIQALKTTTLPAGSTSYTWTINQSNIVENTTHQVTATVKFRDAQIVAEGGTTIGDGADANIAGDTVNYIRLHAYKVRSRATEPVGTVNCDTFTGAEIDLYTTKSLVSTDLADTDYLFAETNKVAPSGLAIGNYAVSFPTTNNAAYKTVFTVDGEGSINTILADCTGDFPASTTTTSTTTGACTSFTYKIVPSMSECSTGPYTETGYSNTGTVVGSRFFTLPNCTSDLTNPYIQLSNGDNYEVNSNGVVLSITTPAGC